MTLEDLLDNIHNSRGLVKHSFRIHEGWTFKQLVDALQEDPNIKYSPTSTNTKFEGMLYPDTYQFAWGVSSQQVIQYARNHMRRIINQAWLKRDSSIPIKSKYEALIVASLIQTEASYLAERPKVAAVIYNRLRKRMRLQIDPTVVFGLGLPYGSILTKLQLRKKTAYNTYRIYGLPPTPIAFPTKTAIMAALHPATLSAFYYVAKGDGTHVFSNNYKGHKRAVTQYRAFLNEQKWQQQKEALKAVIESAIPTEG